MFTGGAVGVGLAGVVVGVGLTGVVGVGVTGGASLLLQLAQHDRRDGLQRVVDAPQGCVVLVIRRRGPNNRLAIALVPVERLERRPGVPDVLVHLQHHGLRAARRYRRPVVRRRNGQLVGLVAGCRGFGDIEKFVALLGDVVGHGLLVGITEREADVEVVAGVGHLDLACPTSVDALEVGAVVLGGGSRDAGRAKENESCSEHGHLEAAQAGPPSSKSRIEATNEVKIGHRRRPP